MSDITLRLKRNKLKAYVVLPVYRDQRNRLLVVDLFQRILKRSSRISAKISSHSLSRMDMAQGSIIELAEAVISHLLNSADILSSDTLGSAEQRILLTSDELVRDYNIALALVDTGLIDNQPYRIFICIDRLIRIYVSYVRGLYKRKHIDIYLSIPVF